PIGGRPLVAHVISTARDLDAAYVRVVVRHERDRVAEAIDDGGADLQIVDQDEIPGTGRTVEVALQQHPGDFGGDVLVLSGDVPLLEASELAELIAAHRASGAAATLLSARMPDPTGYGRVVRAADGTVERIVEQKDASADEAAIDEINAGVYVFRAAQLRAHIGAVGTANSQGERYLTDVIGLLRAAGDQVAATVAPDPRVALGVNDRIQLAEAARILNDRIVRRWQREGVTVMDPATTWIDETVTLAPDVTVRPNTQLLRATV